MKVETLISEYFLVMNRIRTWAQLPSEKITTSFTFPCLKRDFPCVIVGRELFCAAEIVKREGNDQFWTRI